MVIILYLWYIRNGAPKLLLMAQPVKHSQSKSVSRQYWRQLRSVIVLVESASSSARGRDLYGSAATVRWDQMCPSVRPSVGGGWVMSYQRTGSFVCLSPSQVRVRRGDDVVPWWIGLRRNAPVPPAAAVGCRGRRWHLSVCVSCV